jgi:hypothetical protein
LPSACQLDSISGHSPDQGRAVEGTSHRHADLDLDRVESSGHRALGLRDRNIVVAPGNRGCIGVHALPPHAAEDAVKGLVRGLPDEIPQGDVAGRQRLEEEPTCFPREHTQHLLPKRFHVEWVASNEQGRKQVLDHTHVGAQAVAGESFPVAHDSVLRLDFNEDDSGLCPWPEGRHLRLGVERSLKGNGADRCDLHRGFSSAKPKWQQAGP